MSKTHVFYVDMACEGCSGAVERVLNRHKDKGVENIDINLPEKKVTVTATLSGEELLEIIKKTDKKTTLLSSQ